MGATSLLMTNWMFLRKDTYVGFVFRGFRFDTTVLRDIFRVGLPASIMYLTMSFMIFLMNLLIVGVGGTDGIAIFATGWRVVTLATLPVIGISTAVVSVVGAAFGAREYPKMNVAFLYAVRLGLLIEIPAAVLVLIFAPWISLAFTWTADSARIGPDLILFLMITVAFYPAVALGPPSGAMFQGVGKGMNALTVTVVRTIILMPPIALLFAYPLGLALPGVWWGIVFANALGASIAFLWARAYLRSLASGATAPAEERAPLQVP